MKINFLNQFIVRALRVWKNLKYGADLAWAASPKSLVVYCILGMAGAVMAPFTIVLSAKLVNKIASAHLGNLFLNDLMPLIGGLWIIAVSRCMSSS